jgi:hypothetical protein
MAAASGDLGTLNIGWSTDWVLFEILISVSVYHSIRLRGIAMIPPLSDLSVYSTINF